MLVMPPSRSVGTFGRSVARSASVTAMAKSCWLLMNCNTALSGAIIIGIWPATRSVTAGWVPL